MMTMVISGSDGVTFPDSTNQFSGGAFSFKNRIINGDMRIDQRNAGAAVTGTGEFPVDRFVESFSGGEVAISAQQDSSAPTGFVNSTKITITTAEVSVGADDRAGIQQRIEGTNVADLAWGTASAKTITLSFWVRSSVTGNFGGVVRNSANNRAYPFTYAISVADTWEYKTVTIPGDTTGTWLTTTGIGLVVNFSLMAGTNFVGTAGVWDAAGVQGATGQVQLATTLNATWYITGVQLEVGSVATPFERRPYGTELALCQRYYWKTTGTSGNGYTAVGAGGYQSTTNFMAFIPYPVQMRAAPTFSISADLYIATSGFPAVTAINANYGNQYSARLELTTASSTAGFGGCASLNNVTTSFIDASAEL